MNERDTITIDTLATCAGCGWVHFAVTRAYAEDQVKRMQVYFDTLTRQKQRDYYGGKLRGIEGYERCFFCGGSYKNFRPAVEGDCPIGCTIGPIIRAED